MNRLTNLKKKSSIKGLTLIVLSLYVIFNIDKKLNIPNSTTFTETFAIFPRSDEAIEKLWGRPERIICINKRKSDEDIRYAAFGSSVTWGSKLNDRENEVYVKLLSPEHGDNYGLRANGPSYPASCVHTMIGDSEYDVIILEFFMRQEMGMMTLAKRLRERFPDAIIIILRQWFPQMLKNSVLGLNLEEWNEMNGFGGDFIKDKMFEKKFIESEPEDWKFRLFENPSKVEYQEMVARETRSYISIMPFNNEAQGSNGFIELGKKYLADDSFHLSAQGHANIAMRVKEIVDRVGVPKNPIIGEFHHDDSCQTWLQTGEIKPGLTYGSSFEIRNMPNTQKFTLELLDDQTRGWIKVMNTHEHHMRFYIGYMTNSPGPFVYPWTEARIDANHFQTVLDPESIGFLDMRAHIPRLIDMGTVPPGESEVSFEILEKSEWPFRIVQIILTANSTGVDNLIGTE